MMNNKKPKYHQRLLDGMPPHVAKKVDKMITEMKEVYDLAVESWEGCDGCTENDRHFFIQGFRRGYNMDKSDKINLEEVPEEQLNEERNPNYKYFDIDSVSIEEIEEEAKFRSQIESHQYADGFFDGIEWFIEKLKLKT